MQFHIERKKRALAVLLQRIEHLVVSNGQSMPCHYPGAARNAVVVDLPPLRIEILPDRFRACAAKNEHKMFGEAVLEREGWKAIEIRVHNERRLCVNVGPEECDIHFWVPGVWETIYFGIDTERDTIPVRPELFEDPRDPQWQAFSQSSLANWPPEFSA